MACRGFWECLLKLLNFLLILVGLAMIGYGVYLFVGYKNAASTDDDVPISPTGEQFVQLGRPMLLAVSLADNIFDKLPKACVIMIRFRSIEMYFRVVESEKGVFCYSTDFTLWENAYGRTLN
ncbi:UNVERIFIED_CONTAM: Tobamovirus multiplication protein 2A [Sesamum radiatum]|uniref:Tobamovirus multiplication protein 2A n=1 Tax=Sesamum radiatum TaxID=300843 RepID=A0AAW2JP10_SESRA